MMQIVGLLYDLFMLYFEKRHGRHLRRILCHNVSGKILDVGSGTGANLRFIKESTRSMIDKTELTLVDPNKNFNMRAKQKAQKLGLNVNIEAVPFEDFDTDDRYDYVLSSLTMCSCKDLQLYTQNAMKLLKPGGEFRFMEHTYSENRYLRKGQQIIDKIIVHVFREHPHLTRPIIETIQSFDWNCELVSSRTIVFPICRVVLGVCKQK
ncbi:hypothetical protein GEMRC1_012115 [Eukaryota sp. GEM-RC1]